MADKTGVEDPIENGQLCVDFVGEIHMLDLGQTLTFGRDADLNVDDNRFLHRQLGRFESRGDLWWLSNIGGRIELEVFDVDTQAKVVLTAGTAQALPGERMLVRFKAGQTTYEIDLRCPPTQRPEQAEPSDTVSLASLPLTDSQRQLIVVLSESKLLYPHEPLILPTNKDACERLGWTVAQFNRKLDNVCEKLAKAGVPGLKPGSDGRNNLRRQNLVESSIAGGLITEADLAVLDAIEPSTGL